MAAVAALLSLGACAPVSRSREAALHVPDERLYEQIAEIDHVTDVSVQFSDDFGAGPTYDGDIVVDDTADPVCVLDQVNAILWQGHRGDVAALVVQGKEYVGAPALGLSTTAIYNAAEWQKWIDRYGPHPLAGPSPKPSPRPAPPAGGPCG